MISNGEEKKLTAKQKKFCEEYLVDLNITQAAIRAGYSKKTACNTGNENIRKQYISEYIALLQGKLREKTGISVEKIVAEYAKIAFADMRNYVNGGNTPLEIKYLDENMTAVVSKVKTTVTKKRYGDVEVESITSEISLHSKVQALDALGRHLGIFEKDNLQHETTFVIQESVYEAPKKAKK